MQSRRSMVVISVVETSRLNSTMNKRWIWESCICSTVSVEHCSLCIAIKVKLYKVRAGRLGNFSVDPMSSSVS